MKSILIPFILLFIISTIVGCTQKVSDDQLKDHAEQLAQTLIIVDTHIDVPYRLKMNWEDVSVSTQKGNFDYPRARQGGLDVPFMSIYVPAKTETEGTAKQVADSLIEIVENLVKNAPNKFSLVKSVQEIKEQFGSGRVLMAMGMENGAPIEGDLTNLNYFYNRGIRYITLTHSKSNHICDSSYDPNHQWNGLSPFGREVITEMNRMGIMVDISHVTDSTFYQVIEISKAPVIASHSSCRVFTPGWERNMSDDMIKRLAENGGVIQINFGSSFVNDAYRKNFDPLWKYFETTKMSNKEQMEYAKKYQSEHPIDYADITDVVAHLDHVVNLVGIDHVGIGSDFDGLGDSLPHGLKDVSAYPNLIYELLKKGYSEEDIEKVCSGNIFRVWSQVEKIAKILQAESG